MKSCFGFHYSIPFETYLSDSKTPSNNVIQIKDVTTIQKTKGRKLHDVYDYQKGPRLEIFEDGNQFYLSYAEFQVRFEKTVIHVQKRTTDPGRLTKVLERVILPLHLTLLYPNIIPLHGGAVKIGNQSTILIGDSGAGKSTSVYELMKKGAKILSDDLVLIDLQNLNVLPGLPTLRSHTPLNTSLKIREHVGPNIEKWWHLFEQTQIENALPIHHILYLDPSPFEEHQNTELTPLRGFEKAALLLSQSFAFSHPDLERQEARLRLTTTLAKNADMYRLHFSKGIDGPEHIDELMNLIVGSHAN